MSFANLTTTPGTLLGLALQTNPALFQTFLHHGFGRRQLRLFHWIGLQLLFLLAALAVRNALPQTLIYGWLQSVPPYNADPALQALMQSEERGMLLIDNQFFAGFAVLFLLVSLIHYARLSVQRFKKVDAPNTYFWGHSWLAALPGVRRLSPSVISGVLEPLLVLVVGYALCAVAPAFGLYVMAGAVVLAIEQGAVWRRRKTQELDTRDAMVHAEIQQEHQIAAQEHIDRVREAARALMPDQALARVQTNPHALLALPPDKTWATCELLGSDAFGELGDHLEPDAQKVVYDRLAPGNLTVPEAKAQSA